MPDLVLVLGNKNLSSWSLRPWLLLRQAGIAFEERVVLFEEPRWRETIVRHSPSGRVPALRDRSAGDLLVWDSLAICEYVAELFPEAKLWPEDRAARAVARASAAEMHSGFANLRHDLSMDVTARLARRRLGQATQKDVDRILELWEGARARFGSGGPFLFGRFSVADAMFAPVVWRFRTYDVPLSGAAKAWYEAMLELPAMKAWEHDARAEVEAAASLANPGKPPDPTSAQHCFAVIFSSQMATGKSASEDYESTAEAMVRLAKNQPGFLGIESARGADGFGITVSYWDSLDAISRWKANPEHRQVQRRGREMFYTRYEVRICNVERGYKFPLDPP